MGRPPFWFAESTSKRTGTARSQSLRLEQLEARETPANIQFSFNSGTLSVFTINKTVVNDIQLSITADAVSDRLVLQSNQDIFDGASGNQGKSITLTFDSGATDTATEFGVPLTSISLGTEDTINESVDFTHLTASHFGVSGLSLSASETSSGGTDKLTISNFQGGTGSVNFETQSIVVTGGLSAQSVELTAKRSGTISLSGGAVTSSGKVSIDNDGLLTIATDVQVNTGALGFTQTGNGAVSLGGSIQTNNGPVSFEGNVSLPASSGTTVIKTTGSIGAVVEFNGTVSGDATIRRNLQVISGKSTTTFLKTVSSLGQIFLQENADTSTGAVEFVESVSASGLTTASRPFAVTLNSSASFETAVTVVSTGLFTLGDLVSTDAFAFAGGLTNTAGTTLLQANSLSSSGTTIQFGLLRVAKSGSVASGVGSIIVNSFTIEGVEVTLGNGQATPITLATINGDSSGSGSLVINSTAALIVTGAVGGLNDPALIRIQNAASNATFQGTVKTTTFQIDATNTGLVTLQQALTATTLSPLAGAYSFRIEANTAIDNTVTFANTGALVLGNAASDTFSFSAGFIAKASSTVTLAGSFATGDSLDLGPITLAETVSLDSGNALTVGVVTTSQNRLILESVGNLVLGNVPDLRGSLTLVDSGGTASFAALGSSKAGLFTIIDSQQSVTISGIVNATAMTITANQSGGVIFSGSVTANTLSVASGAGDLTFLSDVTISGTTSIVTTGQLILGNNNTDAYTFSGGLTRTDGATTIQGKVSASASFNISIADVAFVGVSSVTSAAGAIVLSGATTINSTASLALNSTTGGITVSGDIDSTLANTGSVSINTSGPVVVSGAVGSTKPLSTITLTKSSGASFGALNASNLVVSATAASAGQTVRLEADIAINNGLTVGSGGYDLSITGSSVSIAGITVLANTGKLVLGNADGDGITFTGGLTATVQTSISLQGSVATSGSSVVSLGDIDTGIAVSGTSVIGSGTTGNITLGDLTLAKSGNLTIQSVGGVSTRSLQGAAGATGTSLLVNATGDLLVNGAVENINTLSLDKAAGITFKSIVGSSTTVSLIIGSAVTGTVLFEGNFNEFVAADFLGGSYSVTFNKYSVFSSSINFTNTGLVTLNGISVTGAFASSSAPVKIMGNIAATGAVSFGQAITVAANVAVSSSGSSLTFEGTIDATTGSESLTIGASGLVNIKSSVGKWVAPSALRFSSTGSIIAESTIAAGTVVTDVPSTGSIEFMSAITAPGGVTLAGSTAKLAGITSSASVAGAGGNVGITASTITLTGNILSLAAGSGIGVNYKGGAISLTGNVILDGTAFTICNDPITGGIQNYANNPITINGSINGQAASSQALSLLGLGTIIHVTGQIGVSQRLASLNIGTISVLPMSVAIDGAVHSDAIAADSTAIFFGNPINVTGSVQLSGTTITLADAATITADSMTVTVQLAGVFTMGTGTVLLAGALNQIGGTGRSFSLGANITAGSVSIEALITLSSPVTIDTSASSGIINLYAVDANGNNMTLNAGTADLISGSISDALSLAITSTTAKFSGADYSASKSVNIVGNLSLVGSAPISIRSGTNLVIVGDIDDTTSKDSALTLSSSNGTIQISGSIGAGNSLASLDVSANSILVTGDIGAVTSAGTIGSISFSASTVRLEGSFYRAGTTFGITGQRITLAESGGVLVELRADSGISIASAMSTTIARGLNLMAPVISISNIDGVDGAFFQNTSLLATGVVTLAGNVFITDNFEVLGASALAIAASLSIDTDQGDGSAGMIVLGNIPVHAALAGLDLTLDARASTGGDISFGTVDGAGGHALRSFKAIAFGNVQSGAVSVNTTNISTFGGGATGIVLDGNIVIVQNLTLTSPGAPVHLAMDGGSVSTAGQNRSLAISTVPVSGAGGSIVLGAFNDFSGGVVGSILLSSSGTGTFSSGSLTLLKDMSLQGSLVLANQGNVIVQSDITIDTNSLDNASKNDVLFGGSSLAQSTSTITAGTIGARLTIRTAGTTGGGNVGLGRVGDSGGVYLDALVIDAGIDASGVPGTVRLNGSVSVSGNITLDGLIVVPASLSIDSNKGAVPGTIRIASTAGSLSGSSPGVLLDINTESAFQAGGSVSLGIVDNAGGFWLQSIAIKTRGGNANPTPGSLNLSGSIQLDGFSNTAAFIYDANNQAGSIVTVTGAISIDTAQLYGIGGSVYLGSTNSNAKATISSNSPGAELTISTDALIRGGDVVFGRFDGTQGDWLESLTINSGSIASLDGLIVANSGFIGTSGGAGISLTGSLVLLTNTILDSHDAIDASGGGGITLTGAVGSLLGGFDFVIDSSSSAAGQTGGDVLLDAVGGTTSFVKNMTVLTSGLSGSGRLILRDQILLDGTSVSGASFVFNPGTAGGPGTVLVRENAGIDTEQGGNGPAGDILLGGVTLSSADAIITSDAAGIDFALVAEGTVSGQVAFGSADSSGNFYLQTILVDSDSASGTDGIVRVNGASLSTSGTTHAGDIVFAGSRIEFSLASVMISTANGATSVDGGVIDLSGSVAALVPNTDIMLDTSTSANGRSGGAIRLDVVGIPSAWPRSLSMTTSGPITSSAGEIYLAGSIFLDGGDLLLSNYTTVNLEGTIAIDTAQTATVAGNVLLGDTSSSNATARIRSMATGVNLTISVSAASMPGMIALGAVEAGGLLRPQSLVMDANGVVVGTIALNGDLATSGPIDIEGNVRLGGSRFITTSHNGSSSPISLAASYGTIGANGTGYDLVLDTVATAGVGTVILGPVVEDSGNYLNDLVIATGGASSGNLVLRGSVILGSSGGDLGDVTFETLGGITIVDSKGSLLEVVTSGGTVILGGTSSGGNGIVRPGTAGDKFRIDTTSSSFAGDVAFGSVEENSGMYFGQIVVDTLYDGSDRIFPYGTIYVNGSTIVTAGTALNSPSVALYGSTRLARTLLLSTFGNGISQGGSVTLAGDIQGQVSGIDLSIRTAGGTVRLETITTVRDLNIDTSGLVAGNVFLTGNISLEGAKSNRGDLVLANPADIVLDPIDTAANSISIVTDGGVVLLGGLTANASTASISAAVPDVSFEISTVLSGISVGNVAFGVVDGRSGHLLSSFDVDSYSDAALLGQIYLNGDIHLGVHDLKLAGNVILPSQRSITLAGGDAYIAELGGTISGLVSGIDLSVVTGGGAIALGPIDNLAGSFLNDLMFNTLGVGSGSGGLVLNGNLFIDSFGTDAASLVYLGNDLRLNSKQVLIDTLQASSGQGGDVLLGSSTSSASSEISATIADSSFLIDTRGSSASGKVAFGSVGNSVGGADRFYPASFAVNALQGTSQGDIFINGSSIAVDGITDFGTAVRDAEVYLAGNILVAGSLTIDTQATGSVAAGDVVIGGSLTVFTGVSNLFIDSSSSVDILSSGIIDTFLATTVVSGSLSVTTAGGSTGGRSIRLGQTRVVGNTRMDSGSDNLIAGVDTNSFLGSMRLTSSGIVFINNADSLILSDVAIGSGTTSFASSVSIGQEAGASIRQSSASTIRFRSGSGGISLSGSANEFLGSVNVETSAGGSIQINDSTALNLSAISMDPSLAGTLVLTAKGDITQDSLTSIVTGTGSVTVQTDTASIRLVSSANAFHGPLSIKNVGASAIAVTATGDLVLGRITMSGDKTGSLTITASKSISQASGSSITTGTGVVSLTSQFGDIVLNNSLSNSMNGPVSAATPGNVRLTARNGLIIDSGSAATAQFIAEAGTITDIGMLSVSGNTSISTLASGATIIVDNVNLTGSLSLSTVGTGGDATVVNVSNLTFQGTVGGSLTARSIGGSLSDSGTIRFGSRMNLGSSSLNSIFDTVLTTSVVGGGVSFEGPGRLVLAGNSTYDGTTVVTGGVLEVNGILAKSQALANGGLLRGSGNLKGIVSMSNVSAGTNVTGILSSVGNVVLAAGSTSTFEFRGGSAGIGYDQLVVTGTVIINNANLALSVLPFFNAGSISQFTIISNRGRSPVQGQFRNLPEGASLVLGGARFQITYKGGALGRDVVLKRASSIPVLAASGLPMVASSAVGNSVVVRQSNGRTSIIDAFDSSFHGGVRSAAGFNTATGQQILVAGTGAGIPAQVKVFNLATGSVIANLNPFPGFQGGVFVATGDVNKDGVSDFVVSADAGTAPMVRVYDGKTLVLLKGFLAYTSSFRGGVRVACADVNGDGFADVVTGNGAGALSEMRVFDAKLGFKLTSMATVGPVGFRGGIFVAAGDLTGDGKAELIAGLDQGSVPQVTVIRGGSQLGVSRTFLAMDASFRGGVRVGVASAGGAFPSIITGNGAGVPAQINVFDGRTFARLDTFFSLLEGDEGVFV